MISGNFIDLLTILSDREKETVPRKFFLDYDIIKNRNRLIEKQKKNISENLQENIENI